MNSRTNPSVSCAGLEKIITHERRLSALSRRAAATVCPPAVAARGTSTSLVARSRVLREVRLTLPSAVEGRVGISQVMPDRDGSPATLRTGVTGRCDSGGSGASALRAVTGTPSGSTGIEINISNGWAPPSWNMWQVATLRAEFTVAVSLTSKSQRDIMDLPVSMRVQLHRQGYSAPS